MWRLLVRALGFVLIAGAVLHLTRSSLGGELGDFLAADASKAYRNRALGLVLFAFVCSRFKSRPVEPLDRPLDEPPSRGPWIAQVLGLTFAGAGAALALEALARHARQLVTTAPVDFTILGGVLLVLGLFGALAFAPLFDGERRRPLAVALGAVACALFCVISLRTLQGLGTPQGFAAYVGQFGLGGSQRGYFTYTALLGGTLFALPAFALGTAAACSKRRELVVLLCGGAVGLLLVPRLLSRTDLTEALAPSPFSAGLVRVGLLLAAIGGLTLLFSLAESRGKTRVIGATLAAASLVSAFLLPISPIVILAPWQRRPPQPTLVIDAPEGLFVVDAADAGFAHARLDGRTLTPKLEEAGLDAAAIESSVALLENEVRARGLRVLLIGVLTPGRAIALGSEATIDRTASFHATLPALEDALFSAGHYTLPAKGEVLSPQIAQERLDSSSYDLVLAPPVFAGPTPRVPSGVMEESPAGTTLALWIDAANSQVGASALGNNARALLASDGLERWAVGIVRGPGVREFGEAVDAYGGAPRTLALGDPAVAPPLSDWLSTRIHRKGHLCAKLLGERLEAANRETPAAKITQALARTTAMQHESSPFANEAATIEIDERALALLREAALAETPDLFTARLIERMGKTLLGKGWIDETHELLEPIAARYAPRPELETLLAEAEIEGLLFQDAIGRLDRIGGMETGPRALLRARALTGLERPEDALPILRRIKEERLVDPRTVRLELATTLAELDPVAALEELSELAGQIGHDDELERIEEELRARFALEGIEVPPPSSDHGHDHGHSHEDDHEGHDH